MKIKVIGCGNAFSHINYNQSFLLEENDKRMLIDCGSKIPQALFDQKIDLKSIDFIYISHQHGDHCGGLEEVAFQRYDWINRPRHYKDCKWDGIDSGYAPKLIANKILLQDLWNYTLKGGLDSMEGFDSTIETFFVPKYIEPNMPFIWEGWFCKLVQQVHIMTGSIIKNTFGLIMSKEGHKTVYFTTDSQHCSPRQMEIFYKEADIIFQDCECIGVDMRHKEMKFMSGVHANYAQLAGWESANSVKLSNDIKSKMYLSHYQDFIVDNLDGFGNYVNWFEESIKEGFAGFVKVGQEFNI